jgi:hypothetical protein
LGKGNKDNSKKRKIRSSRIFLLFFPFVFDLAVFAMDGGDFFCSSPNTQKTESLNRLKALYYMTKVTCSGPSKTILFHGPLQEIIFVNTSKKPMNILEKFIINVDSEYDGNVFLSLQILVKRGDEEKLFLVIFFSFITDIKI